MDVDTALAVVDAEQVGDLELVALAPADLLAVQTNLVNWCDGKVKAIRSELRELRENLQIAKDNKWKTSGWVSAVTRTEKRITFYEKIKAAIGAGYLIVPNFPVDVFAVRVRRAKQPEKTSTYSYSRDYKTAKAELLPAGEGRYVDDELLTRDESYTTTKPDGAKENHGLYISDAYDDVDFPVAAVKPVVMAATQRAMALKIFDDLGLVENQRKASDPIVVGRLFDPRGADRRVTFFVAWWLDTATL